MSGRTGFQPCLCHLHTVSSWITYLTSLSLSLHGCNTECKNRIWRNRSLWVLNEKKTAINCSVNYLPLIVSMSFITYVITFSSFWEVRSKEVQYCNWAKEIFEFLLDPFSKCRVFFSFFILKTQKCFCCPGEKHFGINVHMGIWFILKYFLIFTFLKICNIWKVDLTFHSGSGGPHPWDGYAQQF